MSTATPSSSRDTLRALARRVERLAPDRRDPERFFMDKSEIAAELRRLARAQHEAASNARRSTSRRRVYP